MNKISKTILCGLLLAYIFGWMITACKTSNQIIVITDYEADSIPTKSIPQIQIEHADSIKLAKQEFEEQYRKKFKDRYVKYLIKANNLRFPDIVYAQARLESGNFKSDIFLNANNCFGMKHPKQRTTWSKGEYKGHAKYRNIEDCIKDYKIWQNKYTQGMNRDEYLSYIGRVYSEVNDYVERLNLK